MAGKLRDKWSRMTLANKVGIFISLASLCVATRSCFISNGANRIAMQSNQLSDTANRLSDTANKHSIMANQLAQKANDIAEEVSNIQNIPRLSAQVVEANVGRIEGRMDDVVLMLINVYNNSNAFAHAVELDVIISDGTGRVASLNEDAKQKNLPIIYRESLGPGDYLIFLVKPSTFPNARGNYSSGKNIFKAKLQLSWKGPKNNVEYRYLNLMELKYFFIEEQKTIEGFWFDSKNAYNSIDNNKELEENWGLNFIY